jgi:hypothetical protein
VANNRHFEEKNVANHKIFHDFDRSALINVGRTTTLQQIITINMPLNKFIGTYGSSPKTNKQAVHQLDRMKSNEESMSIWQIGS